MTETPAEKISAAGFPLYLQGLSAIDSYLGRKTAASVLALCGADLADLARIFDGLRYPGAAFADAAVDWLGGKTWYFRCDEIAAHGMPYCRSSFGFLDFYQNCQTRRFYDPRGCYPLLRCIRGHTDDNADSPQWWETVNADADPFCALFDGAMILACYFPNTGSSEITKIAAMLRGFSGIAPPTTEEQRLLLIRLLEAANPAPGFELLKRAGFIASFWPELAVLDDVDHSKEFHPEGNVWRHTMETLRYRKPPGQAGFDLRLSLGLLLHDVGKPLAESAGRYRFNGHAELGEPLARRFLERLGFEAPLIHDVCYLVRHHMLPAALSQLPLKRTGEIMESLLFPTLLELYRCDESSSFKGPDGFYQSSAAYQSYLKNRRNPYRSAATRRFR